MKTKFLISFLLTITFLSCEALNDPGQPPIKSSVLYNLVVNNNHQTLYMYRIADFSENGDYFQGYPGNLDDRDLRFEKFFISDAVVTLDDSITYSIKSDSGFKCYYTNNQAFYTTPEETYRLKIKTGNNFISGTTTTPGNFEIVFPRNGEVIKPMMKDGKKYAFDIFWSCSNNAKGYFVNIVIPYLNYKKSLFFHVLCDTSFHFEEDYWNIPIDSTCIQILAYDNNIFQHYYNNKDVSGLENAYGCFGSSVLKEIKILFR